MQLRDERVAASPTWVDEQGAAAILGAVERVGRRSEGPEAWVASPATDPVAFLLDTVADAVNLWGQGSLVYRNRAAERLGLASSEFASDESLEAAGTAFRRRCLRFRR